MTKKIDKICDFFVAWSSVEYLIALQFEILNSCLNLLITCPLNCNKTSRKIAHTIKPNWQKVVSGCKRKHDFLMRWLLDHNYKFHANIFL